MKSLMLFGCCLLLTIACQNKTNEVLDTTPVKQPIAIVLHGGAGTMVRAQMSDSLEKAYLTVLDAAITKGYEMLEKGENSLDVVEQVIKTLEDSPLFNAGKGSVFTNDGKNELDAAIMDGSNQKAGAVAGLRRIKNPIALARLVMEKSEHVMMIGEGAELFAQGHDIEFAEPAYFFTNTRFESLKKVQAKEAGMSGLKNKPSDEKFGTVGCVALDNMGNIAAGTSTGGMTNKRFGRVGDVPIIGAGTYAHNAYCGVSATGWGEYFIRNVVAYDIAAQMRYAKKSLAESAQETIHEKVAKMGGDGGIIALDKAGNVVMEFNTSGMYRAAIDHKKEKTVAIYK